MVWNLCPARSPAPGGLKFSPCPDPGFKFFPTLSPAPGTVHSSPDLSVPTILARRRPLMHMYILCLHRKYILCLYLIFTNTVLSMTCGWYLHRLYFIQTVIIWRYTFNIWIYCGSVDANVMLLLVIDIELVLAYIRFAIKILLFDLVSIFSIPVKNKTGSKSVNLKTSSSLPETMWEVEQMH